MSVFTVVLPVVTLVLGYVGTLFTEGSRDRRAAQIASRERQEQLENASARNRDQVELWTLDRALTDLGDLARTAGAAHAFDMRQAKTTGKYMPTQLGTEMNAALFVTNQRALRTCEYLTDDKIRDTTVAAIDALMAPSYMFSATPSDAERALRQAIAALEVARTQLGARIRALLLSGVAMPQVSPRYHEPRIGPDGLLRPTESGDQ